MAVTEIVVLTVRVGRELHRAAKVKLAQEGGSFQALFVDAVERFVADDGDGS